MFLVFLGLSKTSSVFYFIFQNSSLLIVSILQWRILA